METEFDKFFSDATYRKFKNHLFNYLVRKNAIKNELREITKSRGEKLIVDAGCGISPTIPAAEGCFFFDVSLSAMKILKTKTPRCFLSNVSKLALKQNKVDILICSEVLEHVESDIEALKEFYRVLKPGHSLILTLPIHHYYWFEDDELVGHFRRYQIKDFIRLVEKIGFNEVKIKKISGLIGRVLTYCVTVLFFVKGDRKPNASLRYLLPAWKLINYVLFTIVVLTTPVTPLCCTDVVLISGRKGLSQI